MTLFVTSVAIVLIVSAFCSVSEAAIYAVRKTYILTLVESGSVAGRILNKFKDNMDFPISAILIINTAANTAGASVAGYQAKGLFGESGLLWFTICFTLAVLFFSEIIPKVIGVVHSRRVATLVAVPWEGAIRVLHPLLWLIQHSTRFFKPSEPVLTAPKEEVQQMAVLSAQEGSIMDFEADLVANALKLNDTPTSEILTPRSVVTKLPDDLTVHEASDRLKKWEFSRIPVHERDNEENWTGLVFARDILSCMANNQEDTKLKELAQPLYFVPEQAKAHIVLGDFLKRRTHLFAVLDEYGGVEGVVTLEDVIECLIGREIVDEADSVVDMRALAVMRNRERRRGDSGSTES